MTSSVTISAGSTSSGLIITSGELLTVLSGGAVSNTTVQNGGTLLVLAGGSDTLTVNSGSALLSGGTTLGATVASGGYEAVYAGAVAQGVTLDSGGALFISSGGQTSGTVVDSGATEYVLGSAIASGSVVESGGVMLVVQTGQALGTVSSGGMVLSSGDVLLINNGFTVLSTASGLVSDTSALIGNGERIYVLNGGTVEGLTFSGSNSQLVIENGGSGSGNVVSSGALETVTRSGVSLGTVVEGGGTQIVSKGGVASGAQLFGSIGYQVVSSAGVAIGTIVNSGARLMDHANGVTRGAIVVSGGRETVSGIASGTILNGGRESVVSGGVESQAIVNSNGFAQISSGGSALGDTVNGGGAIAVFSGGSATGVTVSGLFGALQIYAGATVSLTTLISGQIDLPGLVFSSGATSFVFVSSTDMLTVIEGANSATLSLAGSYTSSSFVAFNDGFGVSSGAANGTAVAVAAAQGGPGPGSTIVISSGQTSSGLVVGSGSALVVQSGGDAVSATVAGGGSIIVSGGGSTTGTTISGVSSSFAVENVSSGGSAIGTTVLANANLNVSSGGTASGVSLSGPNGHLELFPGASATQIILSGGQIDLPGLAYVSGATSYSFVSSTDLLTVTEGGSSATLSLSGSYSSGGFAVFAAGASVSSGAPLGTEVALTTPGGGGGSFIVIGAGQTSSGLVVGSGQFVMVNSGGSAVSTTVDGGGGITVNSGGRATGTILSGSTSAFTNETVSSGGVAIGTTVFSGANLTVSSGGTASGVTLSGQFGNVQIYPGATVSQINLMSGQIDLPGLVFSSGATSFAFVSATDMLTVTEGGSSATLSLAGSYTAGSFTAFDDGFGLSSGAVDGTAVALITGPGGGFNTTVISSGQTSSGLVISSGQFLLIESGGAAVSATVEGGGSIAVNSGGSTTGTTISGTTSSFALEMVSSGGTAIGTTVFSGASLAVSGGGTASGVTLSGQFGNVQIYSGAIVSQISLGSGQIDLPGLPYTSGATTFAFVSATDVLTVSEGGSSATLSLAGTYTSGGFAAFDGGPGLSSGGPDGTAIVVASNQGGGGVYVISAGQTSSGTVQSGVQIVVDSGGTAVNGTVLGGGSISVLSGGTGSAITLLSGGTLDLQTGAITGGIALQYGGMLDIIGEPFDGSGSATLDVATDVLTVTGGGAAQTVALTGSYTGDTFALSSDGFGNTLVTLTTTIFYPAGQQSTGSAKGQAVVVGDNAILGFYGDRNFFTLGVNDLLAPQGNNETIAATTGDNVWLGAVTGDVITGAGFAVHVGSGTNVTLGGNGAGAADVVAGYTAVLAVLANSTLSVWGDGNTISLGANSLLAPIGNNDTITATIGDNIWLGAVTGDVITGAGFAVHVGAGTSITIGGNGSGPAIVVAGTGGTEQVQANSTVEIWGDGNTITLGANALLAPIGNNDIISATTGDNIWLGPVAGDTISGAGFAVHVVAGTSISIGGNGAGVADVVAGAGATIGVLAGSSVSVWGDGNTISVGANATLAPLGNNDVITATSGDQVWLGVVSGETIEGAGVTVHGSSGTVVTLGGGGAGNATDTAASAAITWDLLLGSNATFLGDGSVINSVGSSIYSVNGAGDSVTAGGGDAITDLGSSLLVKVGFSNASLWLSSLGSDHTAVIDLVGGAGGYGTASAAWSAMVDDGSGNSTLALGGGATIHFTGVTKEILSAGYFRIG